VQAATLEDLPDLDDVLGRAEEPRGICDADGVTNRRLVEQPAIPSCAGEPGEKGNDAGRKPV
jgi:hypothetical protein